MSFSGNSCMQTKLVHANHGILVDCLHTHYPLSEYHTFVSIVVGEAFFAAVFTHRNFIPTNTLIKNILVFNLSLLGCFILVLIPSIFVPSLYVHVRHGSSSV